MSQSPVEVSDNFSLIFRAKLLDSYTSHCKGLWENSRVTYERMKLVIDEFHRKNPTSLIPEEVLPLSRLDDCTHRAILLLLQSQPRWRRVRELGITRGTRNGQVRLRVEGKLCQLIGETCIIVLVCSRRTLRQGIDI